MPYAPRIAQLIPHAQRIDARGKVYHIVPHRDTETRLLNNLGYGVPAPILSHYDWRDTTPFDSQKSTAELMTTNFRAYVLNEMGTGKTRAALFASDYLMVQGEINKVLVIAPLSTLTTVWESEIFNTFYNREAVVLYGTKARRKKLLNMDVDFYIINHDGVSVIEQELRARTDINAVIIDELALLRNHKTGRWKATRAVIARRKYVWGLTGAPTPKEPVDAYGQVKLLTPKRVPPFKKQFKLQTMYQINQFRWLARDDASEVVYEAMQPSVRFLRKDCMDLPETLYSTREVEFTKAQKLAYKEMWDEFVLEFEHQDSTDGEIVAANAGVQLSKLLQIGCGFMYGQDGVVVEIDDEPRVNELVDIIEESTGKVIIFAPFKHAVSKLYEALGVLFDTAMITGDVSRQERDLIFTNFQHSNNPRVLVAHPQTMSHGLTLTEASTIVWAVPPFSLEIYEQANARITRPGQTWNTHIIHIAKSPVEKKVLNVLKRRGTMQNALLELFKEST
jgi:SNF2 family DNA or RNA helicase